MCYDYSSCYTSYCRYSYRRVAHGTKHTWQISIDVAAQAYTTCTKFSVTWGEGLDEGLGGHFHSIFRPIFTGNFQSKENINPSLTLWLS